MIFEDFCRTPQRYTVALLGFGRANRAVADWLISRGGSATVYADLPIEAALCEQYLVRGIRFAPVGIPDELGESVLVRSPVIRPDHPAILRALARGGLLTSETELFLAEAPATVIGVTGSDGKTTTATLTARLLEAAGQRTWLGGNNGTPLLPRVCEMRQGDLAVLELSSFQLMTLQKPPAVAVMTNLCENHLNWHTDMAEYTAAKCRIFGAHTRLVANADNALLREAIGGHVGETLLFSALREWDDLPSGRVYPQGDRVVVERRGVRCTFPCLDVFRLPGRHNLENLLAAVGAAAPWLTEDAPRRALADFSGVAHRLQYVGTAGGVSYYNSSIDTTPTRTAAALAAIGCRPIVILGGRGKGLSYQPLVAALQRHAKAACLYGETAAEIAAVLPQDFSYIRCTRFEEAFSAAAHLAEVGDSVLLSPACTAFDAFPDFAARGDAFCQLVKERIKHVGTEGSDPRRGGADEHYGP